MAQRPPNEPQSEGEGDSLPFLTLVPNMVTTLGLCAGLTAIRSVMAGQFLVAVWLILFSAVIDGLDGLIARRLGATSDFGAQLDSLSDFLNFGVAPGFLIYQMAFAPQEKAGGWIFVLVYIICCCMRLARFNVALTRAATNGETKSPKHFTGVPAPAGALMALLPVFVSFETGVTLSHHPVAVEIYIGIVGLLMVSRLPTFSPKSIRVPRERAAWIMVALALFIGTMLAEVWKSLIAIILVYAVSLLHSAVMVLIGRRR
ncbi:CDP-diacylglycerol--serine O-phosphatidyltransferase [Defluviimonas sp. SAOS-178_SWC]|uniref:CDP-diacylglycerol--serine O-phosphatidyltransferase n=1 Tax=Defluviimonas sp. SAOS-178_SWC TaxID=3121287 RepID=UPI0032217D44